LLHLALDFATISPKYGIKRGLFHQKHLWKHHQSKCAFHPNKPRRESIIWERVNCWWKIKRSQC